ncbi:MAG: hypothetical protein AAF789_14900, partial [Bacteroidota bacterium]
MDKNLSEKIDLFHAGKLDNNQKADFLDAMKRDPSIEEESNFQKLIIDEIKVARKAELKSRLSGIDVSSSLILFGSLQNTAVYKSLLVGSLAVSVGIGVYLFALDSEEKEAVSSLVIDAPTPEKISALDWIDHQETETRLISRQTSVASRIQYKESVVSNQADLEEGKVLDAVNETAPFSPSVNLPSTPDINDEETIANADLEALPETIVEEKVQEGIDVETEQTNSVNVRYKYYDGKLFLKGDFDKAPYEILEINGANGRRIYLYYLSTFYEVR